MNINQLKYFIAVAETGSFTKAAEQYYISQTAITLQIKQLEDNLGCELLDRTTRPAKLTPAGKTFLIEAKALVERMQTAIERTKEASTGIVGQLRIGYTRGYERSALSNVLKEYHLRFPNVLISCYRCSSDVLANGLVNDDYDLIYTWDSTNLRNDENIGSSEIERVPLVVSLYPSHPFAQRKKLTRKELKGENIIYMSPSEELGSIGDAHFLDMYLNNGYTPNILFRTVDVESVLLMVAAEEGISILPSYSTSKLENAENLVFIPLEGKDEVEVIHALWKKDINQPALKHMIEEFIKNNP